MAWKAGGFAKSAPALGAYEADIKTSDDGPVLRVLFELTKVRDFEQTVFWWSVPSQVFTLVVVALHGSSQFPCTEDRAALRAAARALAHYCPILPNIA